MENFLTLRHFKAGKSPSRLKYAHLTLRWIKEVEIAKSIGEHMTSRSIVARNDCPDYDILDAMIASALKRLLDKHVHFLKNTTDSYEADKIGNMIHEHFRANGVYEAVQGLSYLFSIRLQNDDVQDFDVR